MGLFHGASNFNTTTVRPLDEHRWSRFVEAQSSVVEFTVKDVEVPVLKRVNDVEDHVSASNHVENLTATSFAFSGAFDETRQVKNLDFRPTVFHDTRDTG